jgi:glycosyltransferase involved in cell wall biosynthesis
MNAIAHVLSSFGVGGQEQVALDLAAGQRAAGYRVTAVSLAPGPDGPLGADFAARGVGVHTVGKRAGFDPSLSLRLALFFRRHRIDVVHTHNPQPLIYGVPAARLAGALAVHTKHGANPEGGLSLLLRRAVASLAHAFVAVSATTAAIARGRNEIAEARLSIIPNGIDLARFHPDARARAVVREELGIPHDAWLVGTVGRLAPEKNQELLLTALAPTLGERMHLLVIGDGPEAAHLAALTARIPGGRYVHLAGSRRDIPRLLAALDVFALSSRTEGLPLVLCEAMATALPVVATAVGGIPDVVEHERTGYLVPSGDARALAGRLATLAADPMHAAALGRRGRARALQRYSAKRMAHDYLALYRRLGARWSR